MAREVGPRPEPSHPSAGPSRRRGLLETAMLVSAAALVVASLALPWWGETEHLGPNEWSQTFSPLTGITGSCQPGCNVLVGGGPPTGPISGRHSFSAVYLNRTGEMYEIALAIAVVGGAAALATAAVPLVVRRAGSGPSAARLGRGMLSVALVALALAPGLLAALQPAAMRSDTIARFSGPSGWTASPSPETSFWGSCSPGPHNGVCDGGGPVSWGPGLGWFALVGAAALVLIVALRRSLRPPSATTALSPPPPS